MNLTVLKMHFKKQEPNVIWYRNFKTFDSLKFKEDLNRELSKHDMNNMDYETFQEIMLSLLDLYAPLKQKYIRANQAGFVNKELRKAIMKRTHLHHKFLKQKTKESKKVYNKQQSICVSILKKSKKSYYENLDSKSINDEKKVLEKSFSAFLK